MIFDCKEIKCTKGGEFCIEVDNIRIFYKQEVSFGIITEIVLNSTNFKSKCKIIIDTRKERVVSLECEGFKAEKVKNIIAECLREQGVKFSYSGRISL